jgi:hypothetical protein
MAKMQIPKSIRASKATPIPIPAFAPVLNPWLLESLELFEVLVGGDVKVTVAVTCGETLETVCKPIKANSELEDVVSIELGEAIWDVAEGDAEVVDEMDDDVLNAIEEVEDVTTEPEVVEPTTGTVKGEGIKAGAVLIWETEHCAAQRVVPPPQVSNDTEGQQLPIRVEMSIGNSWIMSFNLSALPWKETDPAGQPAGIFAALVVEAGHCAVQTVTPLPQSVSDAERQQPAVSNVVSLLVAVNYDYASWPTDVGHITRWASSGSWGGRALGRADSNAVAAVC